MNFIGDITVNAQISLRKGNVPKDCFIIKSLQPEMKIIQSKENTGKFILDTQGKVGRLKFRELSQLEIRVWELSVQKWPFQAWAVEDQAGRESVGKRSEC